MKELQDIHPDGAGLSLQVTVRSPLGLHARPSAQLVEELQAFEADVRVRHSDTRPHAGADAKSLLDLLRLAASAGDNLTLTATGPDARSALERAAELLESGARG